MERRRFMLLLCVLFLFGSALGFPNSPGGVNRYDAVFQAAGRRVLMSDATKLPETALVAALDGTVYLLDVGALKPLWSFSSGPQIYSSYQAPRSDKDNASGIESNYFIDCGDDWELYAHNSLGKLKLMKTLEEYISSTPQIAEDGGIVLGTKRSSAFTVDAKTGRVIHAYRVPDPPSTTQSSFHDFHHNATINKKYQSESNINTNELPLYITRTDYTLTSFLPNSDKVLWNVTVAEIGAAFLCQDIKKSLSDILFDESSEPDLPHKMPLPCQSRALVFRFRNQNMFETLSLADGPSKALHHDRMLPAAKADVLPSQPNVEKVLELLPLQNSGGQFLDAHDRKDLESVLPSHAFNKKFGMSNMHDVEVPSDDGFVTPHRKLITPRVVLVLIALLLFFVYHYGVVPRTKALATQATETSNPNIHSKRKKSRKAAKSGSNDGKQDKEDNETQHTHVGGDNNFWMNLNLPLSYNGGGRTIGKLAVSNKEIAKGSNGTIVLEGIYEGRPVAVKRLVRAYNDIALKEIQNLIVSNRHQNIVRWYGVEQDEDFVYLALERCSCSLNDLITMHLKSPTYATSEKNIDGEVAAECTIRLGSMHGLMQDFDLWNSDGYPSPLLLKLMRDIISGVFHLHELGIVYRDLKPQNVLITNERSLCAKLSDMGISKRLVGDMSALSNHSTGCGSSGWQAPELLLHGRQTRAVDLFSLGCVLFFCITGGRHPFGSRLERDINIAKNKVDLSLLEPMLHGHGFVRGDQYAIALALLDEGKVVLGVLACPNLPLTSIARSNSSSSEDKTGSLFFAELGGGTYMQSLDGSPPTKVHVSTTENPEEASFFESYEAAHSSHDLSSLIATKLGVKAPAVRIDSQAKYGALSRGDGAIYLRFPRKGYVEKIWDHAAGYIVVAEAGGVASDAAGKPLDFSRGRYLDLDTGIIVTNQKLMPALLKAVQESISEKASSL